LTDYTSRSDSELQQLFLSGDDTAGSELALRYRRLVKICTRPYFLAGGDSEDLLQEGMIGLLSAMREYDPDCGSSFKTFAELCVKRRIISAAKSASRKKHAPLNDGVSLEDLLFDETAAFPDRFSRSPEDQLLARESEQDFLIAFSKFLSPFERKILSHYLRGLSYREIAEACGRSEKSVDNAVQRIRGKLARHIHYGDFSD
jgi:RNA polymerase sporulation-specific sigma factor